MNMRRNYRKTMTETSKRHGTLTRQVTLNLRFMVHSTLNQMKTWMLTNMGTSMSRKLIKGTRMDKWAPK